MPVAAFSVSNVATMTDRLDNIAIFAAVAEHESFAEAARRLIDNGRASAKRTLIAWVNWMRAKKLASNTIRRRAASIKSLIGTASDPDIEIVAWQVGKLANLPPAVRVRDCTGPTRQAVERMFIACRVRNDPKGRRDECALGLLYWHAFRASEILSIRMRDIDLEAGTIRMIAKRGQGRITYNLCKPALQAIERWIEDRGEDDGPLFSRCVRYRRKVLSLPLTYSGLYSVIRDLGVAVETRCWPHALRHSAISHLAALTGDSPSWGCALSRHRDIRAWQSYHDNAISHVSAADVLCRGQIVRHDPPGVDN